MMLLVDAGNTRIKWALMEGDVLQPAGCLPHRGQTFAQVAAEAWAALDPPQRVVVTNVGGAALARSLNGWMKRRWKIVPEVIVASAAACGVRNAYREPSRLGADRWAALVAAHRLTDGPVCVVDCGTAITLDVLSGGGEHLGGLIVPGLALMRRALTDSTAAITLEDEPANGEVSLLARDTQGAVTGGSLYAAVALIDRVVADVGAEFGRDMGLLITGGDGARLLPLLSGRPRHEPDLVLQGIALLAGEDPCAT